MDQLALGEEAERPETIQERFERFDRNHPIVYQLFVRFSLEAYRADRKVGGRLIWERLRWEMYFGDLPDLNEDFKLNDHYVRSYTRKAMADIPQLHDYFETRKIRTP